ncbi:MAG: hypothetical protein M1838_005463 [Thelocarpon superellum]|nr:MAG: hypothetical protein M1838_005463 [Thelocarpon superellum]
MRYAKRSKVSVVRKGRNLLAREGIESFGTISKAQAPATKSKASPSPLRPGTIEKGSTGLMAENQLAGQKRKLGEIEAPLTFEREVSTETTPPSPLLSSDASCSRSKSLPPRKRNPLEWGPPKGRPHGASPPSFLEHPELARPVEDIQRLFASFLTGLSLHYAHHGTLSPADLRMLVPSMERAWGKRAVLVEDVQRLLGILRAPQPKHNAAMRDLAERFELLDYGDGKVCVETTEEASMSGTAGRPIDHDAFKGLFLSNLADLWEVYARRDSQKRPTDSDEDIHQFFDQLPSAPVRMCSSVDKIMPLLAKGQRRLEEIRAIATTKKTEDVDKKQSNRPSRNARAVADRGKSLLERIRAKEYQQAQLPSAPTPAALARTSALDRLDEIVPILTHLSTATSTTCLTGAASTSTPQRVSIPLRTLIQHLQNSLINPLSAEEGEGAVRLLATSVAPAWVEVVSMGKLVAVVVKKRFRPTEAQLKAGLVAAAAADTRKEEGKNASS